MQSISIKKLRASLPAVRKQLKEGQVFLLIYQSKPIATLTPLKEGQNISIDESIETELATINDMKHDYLNEKELQYYLSLK